MTRPKIYQKVLLTELREQTKVLATTSLKYYTIRQSQFGNAKQWSSTPLVYNLTIRQVMLTVDG